MKSHIDINFSNHLDILYEQLKNNIFARHASPLTRHIVVVYGPAVENWLMLKMAQDNELQIALGVEYIYLNQAFEYLLKLTSRSPLKHFPTTIELSLAIEKELLSIINDYPFFSAQEQNDWLPLLHYLKIDDSLKPQPLTTKIQKRVIGISQHIAQLFNEYGRYGHRMILEWNEVTICHWQKRRRIVVEPYR